MYATGVHYFHNGELIYIDIVYFDFCSAAFFFAFFFVYFFFFFVVVYTFNGKQRNAKDTYLIYLFIGTTIPHSPFMQQNIELTRLIIEIGKSYARLMHITDVDYGDDDVTVSFV